MMLSFTFLLEIWGNNRELFYPKTVALYDQLYFSDKIVPWLRARFDRKQGGKTAIQEVITLYSHDFPRDSIYFPLESFQVGQLVRQGTDNIKTV